MTTVYMVMGSTGEYSDRSEWPVMAYLDKAAAEAHVLRATAKAKELQATRTHPYSIEKGVNEHDPNMQMDYTGTTYFIYEATLVTTASDT